MKKTVNLILCSLVVTPVVFASMSGSCLVTMYGRMACKLSDADFSPGNCADVPIQNDPCTRVFNDTLGRKSSDNYTAKCIYQPRTWDSDVEKCVDDGPERTSNVRCSEAAGDGCSS